jgi:hypothetical protein
MKPVKGQTRDFFIGGIDSPRAITGQGKCSRYRKCPKLYRVNDFSEGLCPVDTAFDAS